MTYTIYCGLIYENLKIKGLNLDEEKGSMASATSKKTELELTGVARVSLEELLLDFYVFLHQKDLRVWAKDSPQPLAVREKRMSDLSDISDMSGSEVVDNTLLCLINQASYLLGRQLQKLEAVP